MRRRGIGPLFLQATLTVVIVGAGYRAMTAWLEPGSPVDLPSAASAPETASTATPAQLALSLPPVESFRVVIERPLFSPTRRPPLPAPPEPEVTAVVEAPAAEPVLQPEPPAPPPISFALVGIVMSGDQRVALVQPIDGGKAVQLREGEEFGGWTAALIERERAVFRSAYSEEELKLDFRSPMPPGLVPAQPEYAEPAAPEVQPQ